MCWRKSGKNKKQTKIKRNKNKKGEVTKFNNKRQRQLPISRKRTATKTTEQNEEILNQPYNFQKRKTDDENKNKEKEIENYSKADEDNSSEHSVNSDKDGIDSNYEDDESSKVDIKDQAIEEVPYISCAEKRKRRYDMRNGNEQMKKRKKICMEKCKRKGKKRIK